MPDRAALEKKPWIFKSRLKQKKALASTADIMANKLDAMKPQRKIELFSGSYFAACTLGGVIACGPTHTMVTPLDLVSSGIVLP